ncbi:MAG TPA: M15 family metallopeptidase [Polyangiaceae bacterium]
MLVLSSFVAVLLWAALPRTLAAKTSSNAGLCRPQKAKEFLKRPYFVRRGQLDGRRNRRSLEYRVQRYGRIEGLGFEALNPRTAVSHASPAKFFGLPLRVHRAIVPALGCVERRIRKTCTKRAERYVPKALGGFREANTFRGGEVSNHLFGIAVDIDPDRNPCCGCVQPWPTHRACQGDAESIFDRTELPRCWIYAFERYGFYWLGRDPYLRDTMHFEFLGDPERILTR